MVVRALGDITEDGVKSIKLLYICCKTARIGCTSAKHASKLDAFAFGLHYLCSAIFSNITFVETTEETEKNKSK